MNTSRWITPARDAPPFRPDWLATVFLVPDPPAAWPSRFAIVTAHNPFGRTVAGEINDENDAALARHLEERRIASFVVTGASPDLRHRERGRGFKPATLAEAAAVAERFHQDGFFLVEDGELFICIDASGRGWSVGAWHERVVDDVPG